MLSPAPCLLPPPLKSGRVPSACAGWHTCHMVPGTRLGKDDAPRTGWDTKLPAASLTSRTERPLSQPGTRGSRRGHSTDRYKHRCTQRRPQACTPEKHRHSVHVDSGSHAHTHTLIAPKKIKGNSQPVPALREVQFLSMVLKPEGLPVSPLEGQGSKKDGRNGPWK